MSISKEEVLRYLGYRQGEIDEHMHQLIDSCREEMRSLATPRLTYRWIQKNTFDLPGEDIMKHLKHADLCVLLAVTLGVQVDTQIRYYELVDMTRAVVLDACATTFIEEYLDEFCDGLEVESGEFLTSRFSPGYGDLPLTVQRSLIRLLEADKKIGLTVNEHNILIPRKSVTAIMGVVKKKEKKRSCEACNLVNNCPFKREGGSCGN